MRIASLLAANAVVLTALAPAWSLTKTPRRIKDLERDGAWTAGEQCTLSYYNICSGWIWTWGGWPPESRLGIGYGPLSPCTDYGSAVDTQWLLTLAAAPSGYGYTGTISLSLADSEYCPTTEVASQPFLPIYGYLPVSWFWGGAVPPPFLTTIVTTGPAPGDPVVFATDAPSTAPCRPPLHRTHSFTFGTKSAPVCPGAPFDDGGFDAELVWLLSGNSFDSGEVPVSVQSVSWGRVKAMFR